ncbi:MAG: ABC transporter permease [Bacteroidota bacterium]
MIRNYLTIAYRNLRKQKFYALINIFGLSLGLACCLLIALYVVDDLSYDRFYPEADQMYRVRHKFVVSGQESDMADVAPALAQGIRENITRVEKAIRTEFPVPYIYRKGTELLGEQTTIRSDPNFFQFFGYELLVGDPATVLKNPQSIVLTQSVADAYFGKVDNNDVSQHPALGQALTSEGKDYTVTGIAQDPPTNSHLDFGIVMTLIGTERAKNGEGFWLPAGYLTYVILQEGTDPKSLKADFIAMEKAFEWPQMTDRLGVPLSTLEAQQDYLGHYLVPVTDIHLITEGNLKYVYIFSAIGLFMLLIACINYTNLATARSAQRAKEVGIRKALGTTRQRLIGQFLSESTLMTSLAMLIALGFTEILRIPFSRLTEKTLTLAVLQQPVWLLFILLLTFVVSLLAGLYPAFYLSVFKPSEVLKGQLGKIRSDKLRRGLVMFQFGVSATLIICSLLVYQQLIFMQSKDVGFNKENVLLLPNTHTLENREVFRETLLQNSQIEAVSFSYSAPGDVFDAFTTYQELGSENKYQAKRLAADAGFMKAYKLQLLEGRNLKKEPGEMKEALLNKSAADQLGIEQVVGSVIETFWGGKFEVVGVVKDFNFEHLQTSIMPLVIHHNRENEFNYYTSVRIKGRDIQRTIGLIESAWQQHNPDALFTYSFLDRKFNDLFKTEQRMSVTVAVLTGLIIFVACIGLFGLITYVAEQRTKEIGIRKVLGASVKDVVLLLSGSFTRLVLWSFLLAIPLAYVLIQQWLGSFAYRINVEVWPFAIAGIILFFLSIATVSYQSIRAAQANPVDSLRNE